MATIYLADLDNNLVDEIVSREIVDDRFMRINCVYTRLHDAFQAVAGDDVVLVRSHRFGELQELAESAAMEWVERFASRPDRRATLFLLFQKVEPIIETLRPEARRFDWVKIFKEHIDENGFPKDWSTPLREYAIHHGYNAKAIIRRPDYIPDERDWQFLDSLVENFEASEYGS